MIDLHSHTLFSDGVLVPSELARRAAVVGYRYIAFTDHVDASNCEIVVPAIAQFCKEFDGGAIRTIPGVELTHVPPAAIADVAEKCRKLGAKLILVHGETIVEPVAEGTNRAAIEAKVDIIAHPGLIDDESAKLAAKNGVALEISGRRGHGFTNGHVLAMARAYGAPLVFNTDSHQPSDLMNRDMANKVAAGAGMSDDEIETMFNYAQALAEKAA